MTNTDMHFTDADWRRALKKEFDAPYFSKLRSFLDDKRDAGATIYPPKRQIFSAFNLTPMHDVSVVILGQDPYHGPRQAMGLSFSVPDGMKLPPSLKNIFTEVRDDIGGPLRKAGDLTDWAGQGVLLLNSVLTVEDGIAASHAQKGWEVFTDRAIAQLSKEKSGVVYMLWGAYAQKKVGLINTRENEILTAPHPSPLSAYRGFFGCRHFSKANDYLVQRGAQPIQWGERIEI